MAHVNDGIVQCDHCDTKGVRRPTDIAPDFWFYLESTDRTDRKRLQTYVVYACSETCRDALWRPSRDGRGKIDEEGSQRQRDLASAMAPKDEVH